MRDFRTWCDAQTTEQPRRAEGLFFFAADAVPGAVKSSSHTVGSFTGLADAASRTVGSASRTADGFIQTADLINRTADAANHPAGSFDHAAGRIIRPAGASNRTAGRASRANKSFIRTGKSSSRAVLGQIQAQTAKNRPFYPSRHAGWSKSDNCNVRPAAEPFEPQARRYTGSKPVGLISL
jgi:hypothetical protein